MLGEALVVDFVDYVFRGLCDRLCLTQGPLWKHKPRVEVRIDHRFLDADIRVPISKEQERRVLLRFFAVNSRGGIPGPLDKRP